MSTPTNLLYYSTTTYLAHLINNQFYKGQHYVWCSPAFNPASLDSLHQWRNIPASSSPHDLYVRYKADTLGTTDNHSPFIKQNQLGIRRGAKFRLDKGDISQHQYERILYMVKHASKSDFRPLLYLIPAHLVIGKIEEVPVKQIANPLGTEYRVPCLLQNEFEILEF
jgi:hypothetical protein